MGAEEAAARVFSIGSGRKVAPEERMRYCAGDHGSVFSIFRTWIFTMISISEVGSGHSLADEVRDFFAENKIGNSPDFAIMQNDGHVVTVHGYHDNDLAMCLKIVKALKEDAPLAEFTCVPLNH